MSNKLLSVSMATLGIAAWSVGCGVEADADVVMTAESVPAGLEISAIYNAVDGLRFLSPEVASSWSEVTKGVWRSDTGQQLIAGEEGHRWAVEQTQAELAELRATNADVVTIEHKESILDMHQRALKEPQVGDKASCNIAFYNGPSSPFTGFVGSAGLTQLSCTGGTVTFTVQSQACTNSTGCGPVVTQTAVVGSTPGLWGTARSGTGSSCGSVVSVSPPGVVSSGTFVCG